MTAFNVVRMRVKPGRSEEFVAAHKKMDAAFSGMRRFSVVKTGDDTFCLVGEWDSFDDIVAARPHMGGILGQFRDMLEDLGGGLGVTDPVSGSAVFERSLQKPKASGVKRAAKKAKKAAKKNAKKSAKKPAKKARKAAKKKAKRR